MEIIIVKMVVVTVLVLLLSALAERRSTALAGILAAFPTSSAIVLTIYALEQGTTFAQFAATGNLLGIAGTMLFLFGFVAGNSTRARLFPFIMAVVGFLLGAYILQIVPPVLWLRLIIAAVAVIIAHGSFRKLPDKNVVTPVKLSFQKIIFRAMITGTLIILISISPRFLSPNLSGILSAFPTTLFPLMLILSYTYDSQIVLTFVKYVPRGIGATITYSCLLSLFVVRMGLLLGNIIAFAGALVYCLIILKRSRLSPSRELPA